MSSSFIIIIVSLPIACVLGALLGSGPPEQRERENLSLGERFHRETAITWSGVIADMFTGKPRNPPPYKTYPGARVIQLPSAKYRGKSVEECIEQRRSLRNYSAKLISLPQLSQLLHAAQGVTGAMYGQPLRSAPSAGALYPFEIYAVVNRVQGLDRGLYHYAVREHALELVKGGDVRSEISSAGLEQDMLGEANVTFVLAAVVNRMRHKYGERGYRYVYIEAGHISQNIYLQAVSLGLGSVSVGAFYDEKLNQLLGIDGREEIAIYIHAVGAL